MFRPISFFSSFACIEHGYGSIVRVNRRRGTVKVASTIAEDNEDLLVGVGLPHITSRKCLCPLTAYIFSTGQTNQVANLFLIFFSIIRSPFVDRKSVATMSNAGGLGGWQRW